MKYQFFPHQLWTSLITAFNLIMRVQMKVGWGWRKCIKHSYCCSETLVTVGGIVFLCKEWPFQVFCWLALPLQQMPRPDGCWEGRHVPAEEHSTQGITSMAGGVPCENFATKDQRKQNTNARANIFAKCSSTGSGGNGMVRTSVGWRLEEESS